MKLFNIVTSVLLIPVVQGLTSSTGKLLQKNDLTRRDSWKIPVSIVGAAVTMLNLPNEAAHAAEKAQSYAYESRNRNKNKDALIRDDIWYFSGQTPPRRIDLGNLPEGPKWNAWGICSNDAGGNSCTYVSLKQKIPAYSNYAFSISLGAKEFTDLGRKLSQLSSDTIGDGQVSALLQFISSGEPKVSPSPAVDAQLKMVLLSAALLTSPNYTGPPFELLIARFYINEIHFATKEISNALQEKDIERAIGAWEFGRDSWNSYFTIVNKAIVPKVGDKFSLIQ